MQKPAPVKVPTQALQAIAGQHGIDPQECGPLPAGGGSNTLYYLGEALILRVPRNYPPRIAGVASEAVAAQAAYAAGVRTAKLISVDESRTILPVPYTVYERIHGIPLERHGWTVAASPQAWQTVGHDLALLHTRVTSDSPAGRLASLDDDPDPRPWLADLVVSGMVEAADERWLLGWLERLTPYVEDAPAERFCHGDLNAGNVLVEPGSMRYLGLVDWDAAGWSDYVWDFVRVSLRVVPWILVGYERVRPLDQTAEARLLWHYLQCGIFGLRFADTYDRRSTQQRIARLGQEMAEFLKIARAEWLRD